MKLSFLKADTIKEPVKPVQEANRKHKNRGYPIFRSLLITLVCATPITLLYLWWSSRQIHAYGVVTGHVGTLSTPARVRLDAIYVEVGDRVHAGETLYVISSEEARVELEAVRHELAREQARLTSPDGDAGTADGARQTAELSAEHVRLEERAATAGRRLDEVRRLVALQAAVAGDERQALAAYRDAQLNVDVTRLAMERARRTADELLVQTRSRIAELEMRIARLAVLAGPTEIRAESDGVVQSIAAGPGSTLPKDEPVMSVIDRGELWIDTYVPPGKASRLASATIAQVYPTGGAGRPGEFSLAGWHEVRMPERLRETMPRESTAIRLRIDVDDASGLAPGSIARVVLR